MLSTTLVMTSRSTVGTATLCAEAQRSPIRGTPPSANTPLVTAPSLRNWRRFIVFLPPKTVCSAVQGMIRPLPPNARGEQPRRASRASAAELRGSAIDVRGGLGREDAARGREQARCLLHAEAPGEARTPTARKAHDTRAPRAELLT